MVSSSPDVRVLAMATSHASIWLCTIRNGIVFLETRTTDDNSLNARSNCKKLVQLGNDADVDIPINIVASVLTCHTSEEEQDDIVAVVVVVVISTVAKVTLRAWRVSTEEGRDELLPVAAVAMMEMEGVLQVDSIVVSPVGREGHQCHILLGATPKSGRSSAGASSSETHCPLLKCCLLSMDKDSHTTGKFLIVAVPRSAVPVDATRLCKFSSDDGAAHGYIAGIVATPKRKYCCVWEILPSIRVLRLEVSI